MSFLGRFFGPPNVEGLKERGNVSGLIKALSYEDDAKVRHDAAEALGDLGDQRAARPLIDALGDEKGFVRQAAVTALGHLRDPRAVEPLADLLPEPTMAPRAVAALGRIGDPGALVPLLEAHVRARKKRALGMCDRIESAVSDILDRHGAPALAGEPVSPGALNHRDSAVRYEAVKLLGKLGGADAIPGLLDALTDGSATVRCAAAEALGRLEASEAVEPLQGLLQDSSSAVKTAAVRALGAIGDEDAAASLSVLLDDAHGSLRRQAAKALAALGWEPEGADATIRYLAARSEWDALVQVGEPAVDHVADLLADPDWPDRHGAAEALSRLGSDAAMTALIDALHCDHVARRAAAEALVATGGECVIQRLAELLADPAAPSTGRGAAADVLGEIGDAAIEATRPLLWHKDGKTRTLAAEVLAEIGWKPREDEEAAAYWVAKREWDTCVDLGSAAVRPLTMVLQENDPEVREKAAGQLGALGSPQVVEPLSRALRDAEWKVRAAAARSLGKLGDERAVETLTAALEDESKTVQREAVIALGKLGHADTVEPLTAALQLDSSSVRKAAVQALTRIGDPRAFEALITALENDAGAVDATVLDELVKMDDPRVMETLVRKATKTSGASVSWSARETYVEALGTMGQPAIDALAAVLGSGGSTARQYAAIALGEIGDRRAVKPLLLALVDSYTATRNAAADALDEIGWKPDRGRGGAAYWIAKEEWDKCVEIGQPAAGPLISALRVTKWRGGAATALRSLKWGPDAGEALAEHRDTMVRLLKESDQSRVPDAAVHVLEAIGWEPDEGEAGGAYWAVKEDWDRCVAIGQPAVPALTRALGWTSPVLDLSLRRKIVGALSRIGDPALEWLREAVCNDTASMRAAAARALGALADPRAAEPLIAALDDESDEVRRRAARALVEVPDSRAVEPLMTALKDEDEDVRENAMDALGAIGDARALKPVAAALKNRNRQREKTLPSVLRRSAAQVLGELGDERAVGPLMEALDDFDQVVVGNAAVSLAKLGVSDAVEPLLRLLADEDRWFPARAGAAEALGILGDPRAVDALKAALHDEADSVCEKASEALERIKTGPPAVPCAFCGKELHEGAGVRTMSGGGDDPFAAMQEAAQQMLARKVVCSSCGAVFCLECGNAVGVERGTGKTHCPDCGKAVPSSQLM